MALDSYAREISYLRVSVTDRCNLRCRYCMPEEGVKDIGQANILTLEEIIRLVKIAAGFGVSKIRLTGGEPLVRKNITELVAEIAKIPKIQDITLTTNGMLFAGMANELKKNGLIRVNFSLDSLDAEKFRFITRGGEINNVLSSINKALELKLEPVKINVVVMKGINDDEILDFVKMTSDIPLNVRFIEFMPIGDLPFFKTERILAINDIKKIIEEKYELIKISKIRGGGPAKYYQIKNGLGTIGFIGAMSEHFCTECNRIRLTADGKLRGCLYAKQEINIRMAMQNGDDDEKIARLLRAAILEKPRGHSMNDGWGKNNERKMSQIGG